MFCIGSHKSKSQILLDLSTFHSFEDLVTTQKLIDSKFGIINFRPQFTAGIQIQKLHENALDLGLRIIPSTFGCQTPEDAVSTAMLAVEQLGTTMIFLHVMGCPKNGFPDGEGTLEAAR